MPNVKSSIPYPSRRDNERRHDQANEQIKKFYEIFKDMSFEISFTDALILMPKFASTLKALTGNKEKLSKMARTPMNEHCSAVILNKLPRKLGDPGKFLIPCEFLGMDACLALADLGASINLMPLSVWEALSLPQLTSTCMTLELTDRSVSKPIGIAKDVSFKVGVFHFPADFVVIDFEPDLRVPLILGRCFLKAGRALIDVHMGELTLRIRNEAITYNLDQTVRYSANYNQMTANKIDVIEIACKEYSQEVLGFSDVTTSGNPTPYDDPIISTTSPTLTPFEDSDFLLFEEADAFLAILNSKPLPPIPNHEQYLPSFKKELKVCEAKTIKSSVDEPPEVKLKDLPPHLEYAFLKGNNKLTVIIAKELGDEEKSALIKDYKPAVQHQRRVNPKIHDVIKKEVEKLLDAGLIYPISDSPWVSSENELIPTRLVTEWRMLERLAENEFYCFLDGFFGYFQIPIDPQDQEKTTFTCPYETFAYRRMPFGLCNAPGTFKRCMLAIFHDMDEKTMEVFLDDFSVFRNSFENRLSRLDKILQRCEDTNLVLIGRRAILWSKRALSSAIRFLKMGLRSTELKSLSLLSYLIPRLLKGFGVFSVTPVFTGDSFRIFQNFPTDDSSSREEYSVHFLQRLYQSLPNVKEKTHRSSNLDCPKLVLPFELMCDASNFAIGCQGEIAPWVLLLQEFDFKVLDTKGVENLAADHLSRLENPYENVLDLKGINETFPFETLSMVTFRGDSSASWFTDFANYHAGENRDSWSDKLDDALWAFRTAYKTPIECTPYKLVYGKACHLPIELQHKAYWALKQANFDLTVAGDYQKIQLNELNEIRDHAYENSLIYKEKTKRIHDSKIKNNVYNVGDRVLLFHSRLKIFSGKLKTRWNGPFTIAKVFPYGTVELSQANGPNFKVNGHRVEHYFGRDVPQLVVPDLQTSPRTNEYEELDQAQ
nr:reverse transcriptase domain-containing protein [Tanacetum cinerariifolium]